MDSAYSKNTSLVGGESGARLLSRLPALFLLVDDSGCIRHWNERVALLTGLDGEALVGAPVSRILELARVVRADPKADVALDEIAALTPNAGELAVEVLVRDRRGGAHAFALHTARVDLHAGRFLAMVGTDIGDRREQEARERRRNRILTALARGAPLSSILEMITEAVEAEAQGAYCSILLVDDKGEHLHHGAAPNLPAGYSAAVDGVGIGEGVGSCGTAAWRREPVVVEDIRVDPLWAGYRHLLEPYGLRACWSHPVFGADGALLGTFAIYHGQPCRPDDDDIERIERAADLASLAIERKRLAAALEYQARHDVLTGLPNRRRCEEVVTAEIERAERYGNPFSVVMFDVDHFKPINDGYGHGTGDAVLRQLAALVAARIRRADCCGRWGGEEFLLVLPETDAGEAAEVAEALRRDVGAAEIPPVGTITLSFGVCSYRQGEGFDALLARADAALYRAKAEGRNRVMHG